jgi:hypothetical protein
MSPLNQRSSDHGERKDEEEMLFCVTLVTLRSPVVQYLHGKQIVLSVVLETDLRRGGLAGSGEHRDGIDLTR